MTRRVALLVLLALPATFLIGAAGGGSSGFGGGGGGGGGSFGGSGSSGSGEGDPIVIAFVFGAFVLVMIWMGIGAMRYRMKYKRRVEKVRLASAEAAEDDAHFAFDHVREEAANLFRAIQRAWDERDRKSLARMVGQDLMVEWNRRLDDFDKKGWHNRVKVLEPLKIDYVGLVNRDDDDDDRVVVKVDARLEDYVEDSDGDVIEKTGEGDKVTTLDEFWTLDRDGTRWVLFSIEQAAEGKHHIDSKIVASPSADEQRMRDEAVVELAVADKLPEGYRPADVADLDFDGDARAQALDLSVADPRWAPDVLEAAARRAVEGWAEAVDGEDAKLEAVATPEAVTELLYQGDATGRTRLVVRGPGVKGIRVAELDPAADPPAMTIDVDLGGNRYVEDRDTAAVVSGSKDSATTFTERWTLTLDGPDDAPWRLAGTRAPIRGR